LNRIAAPVLVHAHHRFQVHVLVIGMITVFASLLVEGDSLLGRSCLKLPEGGTGSLDYEGVNRH
jgi:hypothetical protein